MRLLVCGGRTWGYAWFGASTEIQLLAHRQRLKSFQVLDAVDMAIGVDVIIHGDAKGADRIAQLWADENRIPVEVFPANWRELGRKAGPLRNTQMLDDGLPDVVICFPGGVGTSDMMGKAIDRDGVDVFDVGGLHDGPLFVPR